MRLQRYPDGAMHWSCSIWGLHPVTSRTWTHHLALTRYRKSSGISIRPRVVTPDNKFQRRYGISAFRFSLILTRQNAMERDDG